MELGVVGAHSCNSSAQKNEAEGFEFKATLSQKDRQIDRWKEGGGEREKGKYRTSTPEKENEIYVLWCSLRREPQTVGMLKPHG